MNIVDNSPELDLSKPDQAALLEGKPVQNTPDKGSEPPVVSDSGNDQGEGKGETQADDKESQIKGLKAELARRQGNADRIRDLENELTQVKAELAKPKSSDKDEVAEAIQRLSDKDLINKQTDWEDELAAARAKYERADESGNEQALHNATARIAHAKRVLSALKQEQVDRGERKQVERTAQQQEVESINTELSGMYDEVMEVYPDFKDQSSDLWKAANEIYLSNPTLMKRLGAAGEIVAAGMAVLKQGAKGTSTAARKDVINKIEKGFGKALSTGAASPNTNKGKDWSGAVTNGEELNSFNAMIEKIKAGG